MGLGREGGAGREGASGTKPFTALAAAAAAASNTRQHLTHNLHHHVPCCCATVPCSHLSVQSNMVAVIMIIQSQNQKSILTKRAG